MQPTIILESPQLWLPVRVTLGTSTPGLAPDRLGVTRGFCCSCLLVTVLPLKKPPHLCCWHYPLPSDIHPHLARKARRYICAGAVSPSHSQNISGICRGCRGPSFICLTKTTQFKLLSGGHLFEDFLLFAGLFPPKTRYLTFSPN